MTFIIELVRKMGTPGGLTHWELAVKEEGRKEFYSYTLHGNPMSYHYGRKTYSGASVSLALVENIPLGQCASDPNAEVGKAAEEIPVHRISLQECIAAGTNRWSCQDWTVDLISKLEELGLVAPGWTSRLRRAVRDLEPGKLFTD